MKRIPLYDETAPIACTLSSEEIPERIEQLKRMRADLDRLERTDHGLLLHFPPGRTDIETDLRRLAVDEKRCCAFFGFDVVSSDEALALRWDGPPSAREVLDRLEAFFTGDGQLDLELAGLL